MSPFLVALLLAAPLPRAAAQEGAASAPTTVNDVAASVWSSSAEISWASDPPGDGQAEYGPTAAYGNATAVEAAPSVMHLARLTGLKPGETVHYRVKTKAAAGAAGVSTDYSFVVSRGEAEADHLPPSVLIMTPGPDAVVGKMVTISANATDNVGVVAVEFMLDGQTVGTVLTVPPFTFAWNTLGTADGKHALSAVARDAAGNSATAPAVPLTVDNTPPVATPPSASAVGPGVEVARWTTNERAEGRADYGTTTAYGLTTKPDHALGVEHSVGLTGLVPGTVYHYRAVSRDQAGNESASDDASFTAGGAVPAAPASAPASAGDAAARAPQKFLTPARADGVNDAAVFGPEAREVSIVDLHGHQVFHESSSGPAAPVVWKCRDRAGRVVGAGVYIATVIKRDGGRFVQEFAVAK
jgi:hypothetical protein